MPHIDDIHAAEVISDVFSLYCSVPCKINISTNNIAAGLKPRHKVKKLCVTIGSRKQEEWMQGSRRMLGPHG